MLMINSFDNPRLAQAFVDYMATQGVILEIQRHETWDIWLADEAQAERVKAELSYFLAHPGDPRYLSASWQTGQLNAGLRYRSYPFMASVRAHAGPLTLGMMALCVVAYLAMSIIGSPQVAVWLAWPFDPSLKFQLWRYVSPLLLHFSLLSLIFNLLWWWYLAGPLERSVGSGKLLTLTLVTALVGGVIQYQIAGPWFGGLGGVVYALVGYVWLRGEREPESGLYLPRGILVFMLLWLAIGGLGLFGNKTANADLVAGMLIGLAMAMTDTLHARKRK
ncbi:rhomboid family intramembrane serine protease GlpG [Cronobacter sakazakii]|uniref:Rhomboid protease GlpG n=1 Tax=Cronobacter sakazakii TaxID=28141 RepID=A0AA45HG85_CROSK|nr:rhomboid family intramembrane serine protease GlpG [Cronobacter sakazakii]EIX1503569.1 rhomboid family intramembrane serine protease GlpG [Cronobacter sakazakii]EIX1525771.1 rhomboid family intramembrane serine protease GlpG [Cronobacter sakazakii]EIX1533218.1 rhomboid family intramembrane serine protease GlpG [Cronobacter sakazakii]EIX1622187.1 rhomboid family intramembrane serine protease GlpG [Cronobacter sakazakii]EIX1664699.1 rhomboid family intramembrane serine protease GlpG [Cronobac